MLKGDLKLNSRSYFNALVKLEFLLLKKNATIPGKGFFNQLCVLILPTAFHVVFIQRVFLRGIFCTL